MTTKTNRKRLSVDEQLDVENTTNHIKRVLKKNKYDASLIECLMDSYDLNSFISTWNQTDWDLEQHFIKHAKKVYDALYN